MPSIICFIDDSIYEPLPILGAIIIHTVHATVMHTVLFLGTRVHYRFSTKSFNKFDLLNQQDPPVL
jgi:formate hydrogenlyase subunit 3/multisubunit Na+/H+ antiporter MnhD subunit